MISKIENLQKYFDDVYLEKTIADLEEITMAAATSLSHPYAISHVTSDGKKYCVANTLSLVEDMIVKPLVSSSFEEDVVETPGKFHLSNGFSTQMVLRKRKQKKVNIVVPDKAVEKIRKDISQSFIDNNYNIANTRLLFRSRNSSGEFLALNIDKLVWENIGLYFTDLLNNRFRQKHNAISNSIYFPHLNKQTVYLSEKIGPSVYYGEFDKNIPLLGSFKGLIPNKKKLYKEKNISFESKNLEIVQPLIKEQQLEIMSEIYNAISNKTNFSLSDKLNKLMPYELKYELVKWALGTYFNKEGLFNNTYSHYLLNEVSPSNNTPHISDEYKQQLGKEIIYFAKKMFKIFPSNITALIAKTSNHQTEFLRYSSNTPIVRGPKMYSSISNIASIFVDAMSKELRFGLPIATNSFNENKNFPKNTPYYCYSDKSGISWNSK